MTEYAMSQMMQQVQGVVRIGTITSVDPAAARAKVTFGGESESAWLPWTAGRGATIKEWAPLAEGEQVVVVSEAGNSKNGVVIGSLFSAANGAPSSNGGAWRLELGGSHIEMTADSLTLSSNGSVLALSAAGIALNGARIDLNE